MLADAAKPGNRIAVGADSGHDTRNFVPACRQTIVTSHVTHHTDRVGGSAVDGHTTRQPGYAMSQRQRKCIEQRVDWGKLIGPMRQVTVHGRDKVDQALMPTTVAYNLARPRSLANFQPLFVQWPPRTPR